MFRANFFDLTHANVYNTHVLLSNFGTLDRLRLSWQVTVVALWDSISAELLLQEDYVGWRSVLKDIQRTIML